MFRSVLSCSVVYQCLYPCATFFRVDCIFDGDLCDPQNKRMLFPHPVLPECYLLWQNLLFQCILDLKGVKVLSLSEYQTQDILISTDFEPKQWISWKLSLLLSVRKLR